MVSKLVYTVKCLLTNSASCARETSVIIISIKVSSAGLLKPLTLLFCLLILIKTEAYVLTRRK